LPTLCTMGNNTKILVNFLHILTLKHGIQWPKLDSAAPNLILKTIMSE